MIPPPSATTSTDGDPFADARLRMVERQLRRRGIWDERVLSAMAVVPRERFVAPGDERRAYSDSALRIGEGQTISQPWIVAFMAQVLELRGRESVLEVGTGSGYSAAILALLCDRLVTIERHPALAEAAVARLRELEIHNVEVRTGDGSEGAPDLAPFEAISVTAAAHGELPAGLVAQLAPGGRIVCPVERDGHELLVRHRDGHTIPLVPVRFVRLVTGDEG